jgi:hypothetical protein
MSAYETQLEMHMAARTVTDSAGRTWTCSSIADANDGGPMGRDVVLECSTESVAGPVKVTVGWQWESMSAPGFARLLTTASPVPRR